jgi:hypothetical protein
MTAPGRARSPAAGGPPARGATVTPRVWPGWWMAVYFSDWRRAITRLTLARKAGPLRVPLL